MTRRALTWSYAFHDARHRERRVKERSLDRIASRMQEARGSLGSLDRALDRLIAILAVVGARSW